MTTTIDVFEPALCCNSGVCGDDIDQALVTFSADLDWAAEKGGRVVRHNLANDPLAFAENDAVKQFLQLSGSAGLPLVLVNGATVLTGSYPARAQLARWAGLNTHLEAAPPADAERVADTVPASAQLISLADADARFSTGTVTGCCS